MARISFSFGSPVATPEGVNPKQPIPKRHRSRRSGPKVAAPAPVVVPNLEKRARRDKELQDDLAAFGVTKCRMTDSGIPSRMVFGINRVPTARASCDAGVGQRICTIGGVLREGKEVVGLVMERCEETHNIIEAELFAISRVMQEALALGIKSLEVQTDCESILLHIVSRRRKNFPEAVKRIRDQMGQFDTLVLARVPRVHNQEADALVRAARNALLEVQNPPQALEAPPSTLAFSVWHVFEKMARQVGHLFEVPVLTPVAA